MSTLDRIRAELAPDIDRLNARISRQLETPNPMLQQIITNSLKTKGKLIRPILVLLTARILGEVNDRIISAAASLELLHNASLVHDDVVDCAMSRHGHPTINAVWDNHVAVLVGDFFVSSAMQLAIETDNLSIIETVCEIGKRLSLGELDQVNAAYSHIQSEDTYMHVISLKTASLFMACAHSAACALDIDDNHSKALIRFAELLGLCFQMRDDVFDYFSDDSVGKPTGNDLREGKITLPLLYAMRTAPANVSEPMAKLLERDTKSADEIQTLINFAIDNGGIDYAYNRMRALRDEADKTLSIIPDSPAKAMLLDLFDFIIERKF